jgi:hypothetical protein
MILNVTYAEYKGEYKVFLTFNNGESVITDIEETIFNENRNIFEPLKDKSYFQSFVIKYNTIEWSNGADFAPEFLLELGKKQEAINKICA